MSTASARGEGESAVEGGAGGDSMVADGAAGEAAGEGEGGGVAEGESEGEDDGTGGEWVKTPPREESRKRDVMGMCQQ